MHEKISLDVQTQRHLLPVIDQAKNARCVSLESTPIVSDRAWDNAMEYGHNLLLYWIWNELDSQRQIEHIALWDDSSVVPTYNQQYYHQNMLIPPTIEFRETELRFESIECFRKLNQQGAIFRPNPTTHFGYPAPFYLNSRTQPFLAEVKDSNGECRTGAALNDAVFQKLVQQKLPHRDLIITVHPKAGGYEKEQRGMREILEELTDDDSVPVEVINVFFTGKNMISKVEHTIITV